MGRFDLLCTDPPYGIGEAKAKARQRDKVAVGKDHGIASWDDAPAPLWLIQQAIASASSAIVFGGNYYALPPSACWLVWDKDRTGDFADCELAWTNLPGAVRKIRWRWNGMIQEIQSKEWAEPRLHPTQKPLAVMSWAIQQAGEVKSVLDPFAGSGTTLRAAKDLGLKAVGIELEEKYCEVAARRLEQGVLFA